MPFLFEQKLVEYDAKAQKDQKFAAALERVKVQCRLRTASLPFFAAAGNDQVQINHAMALATLMGGVANAAPRVDIGGQQRRQHASSYCEWMMLSGNQNFVKDIVLQGIAPASHLNVQVNHHETIGQMYYLASLIFSELEGYVGVDRVDERR